MHKTFRAEIVFLTPEEGGFSRKPQSGVRPQLRVSDVFTTCIVWSSTDMESFPINEKVEVILELPFWEEYRDKFFDGMGIGLYDGSRIIARGRFLEPITNADG